MIIKNKKKISKSVVSNINTTGNKIENISNPKNNLYLAYQNETPFLKEFKGNFDTALKSSEFIGNYFSLPNEIVNITNMYNISNIKIQEPLVFAYETFLKIIYHCFLHIVKLSNNEIRTQESIVITIEQIISRLGIGSLNIISSNYIASYNIRNILPNIFDEFHKLGKLENDNVLLIPTYNNWTQLSCDTLFSKIFMAGLSYDPSTNTKREDIHTLIIPNFFNMNSGYLNNRTNIFTYLNSGFINDTTNFKNEYKGAFNINIYTDFINSQDFQSHLENNITNIISKSIFTNFFKSKSNKIDPITNNMLDSSNIGSDTIGTYFNNTIYNGMIHIFCNTSGIDLSSILMKYMGSSIHNSDASIFTPFILQKLNNLDIFNTNINETNNEDIKLIFQRTHMTEENKLELIAKCISYFNISKNITLSEIYKFILLTIYKYSRNINESFENFLKNFDVIKEYQQSISKRSVSLSFIPLTYSMEDLGGLDIFKQRVKEYKNHIKNLDEHPEYPKRGGAILLGGVPGAGKTLASMYAASYLNRSLYKLDISKMIGSLQGVSEKNMENDLNTIKSMGKVVLLVDEIEKLFGGVASSHQTDGGVLLRMLEKFMSFLAEENPDIFIIMTCNSIVGLPTALMRSGRISNLMFVDFPSKSELVEIIKIQAKIELMDKLQFSDEEIDGLAEMLLKRCNYNGSDIRELFRQTFNYSIGEDGTNPKMEHIIRAFMTYKPNAEKLNEGVDHIRKLFLESFEPASSLSDAFIIYKKTFMEQSENMKANLNNDMKKLFENELQTIFSVQKEKFLKNNLEI